jgi:hypothetical protein
VTIKSHHNVGGLPEKMGLKLVEPLRELFKDEVRALGHELGLPASFIGRHPFPGPGLAIRCPGEITREKLEILRKADAVYIDQIRKHGLYDEIWQAFVAILPVRTVGVMGDGRTYDYACALRAVTSVDGMTADYYPFSHEFLGETATRIINEVKGINRVTYDITSKPPGHDRVGMRSFALAPVAQVAQAEGMPSEAAIIEPLAHSTLQNAGFGLALLPEPPERVVVVSDAFHLPRAWVIFAVLGHDVRLFATQGTLAPPAATRLRWSLREAAAIWFNAGRLATYGVAGLAGIDRDTRIGWFN